MVKSELSDLAMVLKQNQRAVIIRFRKYATLCRSGLSCRMIGVDKVIKFDVKQDIDHWQNLIAPELDETVKAKMLKQLNDVFEFLLSRINR